MPPKRKRIATQGNRKTRASTRRSKQDADHVSSVYADMLAEAAHEEASQFTPSPRALKRRKIEEDVQDLAPEELSETASLPAQAAQPHIEELIKPQQIVYDDFEDSDESDVEFEDVDLDPVENEAGTNEDRPEQKSLQIDLSKPAPTTPRKAAPRRRPVTKAERDFRLDVHKWHVLSLILHGHTRSLWCDDEVSHVALKQLVPKKIISLLHADEAQPSYQRNHAFTKGIEEVCALWRQAWNIDARGLRRAHWKEGVDAQEEFDDAEDPVDLDDFRLAARDRSGSRDLGAQLFTALLRSLALDARLIFSLQVLPFSGVAKGQTSEKPKATYVQAPAQSYGTSAGSASKRKKIRDSAYPVFWTEVLNPITLTWIALDPLVRNTINKPKTQFEPPAADMLNQMTYVLAFEDDHTVHDVTGRYAQWFNAKTRKLRVESTKNGVQWWKQAMRVFKRYVKLPRDKIESEYLAQRSAAEGMPKNVQDFKNHPVYVLERHLRSNEVIHPKREVGKFSAGLGKNAKVETVYRAQDVYACRTADAWYRRGRDVKLGQQPLRRAVPKIRRTELDDEDDHEEEEREGVALYAEFQTAVYQPPPVERGRIPKNAYGNLDVYVASMIPAGAVHISHPLAAQSAKVLAIDYADAVTGFTFKGRQGTAVVNGAVVAAEYTAAMIATIEGLECLGTQEVQAARSKIILGVWKRMLTALRIHQKIESEYGVQEKEEEEEGSNDDNDDGDDDDSTYAEDQAEEGGGGFMMEADETEEKTTEQAVDLQALKRNMPVVLPDEVVQLPIKVTLSPHTSKTTTASPAHQSPISNLDGNDDIFGSDNDGDGDENNDGGGGGFVPEDDDIGGGGFIDDSESLGGGFVVENETASPLPSRPVATKSEPSLEKTDDIVQDTTVPLDPPTANATVADNIDPGHGNPSGARETAGNNTDNSTPAANGAMIENEAGHVSDASLLSHDPDEDDDEPEWLEDAFDSE